MSRFLLLALFGLIAQMIDGSLGMAYGVTSTSLLLASGIAPAIASASVHMAEVGTTLASGVAHWRFGNTDWRTVGFLAVPGGIGAFSGAVFLSSVSAEMIIPAVAIILSLLGVYVLVRFALLGGTIKVRPGSLSARFLLPLGLFAGFLDAAGGGGWGPISTPTLLASGRMQPRKAIGTVAASEFVVATCATIGFFFALSREAFAFPVVGALLLGGMVAAPFAAWLVRRLNPRVLGSAVGGLILLTNGRTLLREFGVAPDVRLVVYGLFVTVWVAAIAYAWRGIRADGMSFISSPAD